MNEIIIELKNVSKTIKKTKLSDDVTFKLSSKNIVIFIGDNIIGKTTTLKIILEIYKKYIGSIIVNGVDFNAYNKDNEIAFIPEHIDFNKNGYVIEYLELIGVLVKIKKENFHLELNFFN